MSLRLYIIRHAEPDYANNTITAPGHLEAKALSKRLQQEKLTRIYSSPMGRALHTMQYTSEATGLEHTVEEWTAELGKWRYVKPDGTKEVVWNAAAELIRNRDPLPAHSDWHTQHPYDNPEFPGYFQELKEQSDKFLLAHGYKREGGRYRIVKPNEDRIAVFCHMGFGLAWLAHLLELPLSLVWSGYWLPPSSVTTVLLEERSEGWAVPRCLGMGDVSHLYESGLPVSSMGLQANTD
jgi:probable phosphoglycerate mutase